MRTVVWCAAVTGVDALLLFLMGKLCVKCLGVWGGWLRDRRRLRALAPPGCRSGGPGITLKLSSFGLANDRGGGCDAQLLFAGQLVSIEAGPHP